ncbi:hypothetical protein [Shewanella fidelis]|uniref:Uncharacterized protein n=1 Tax=Shewanella fidelis TaxID=173509 RepID=A0AAW8NJ11_9GAMM|nr:hypothetical protein [Shewanella fidelis]MDR8523183.1 hypothetical protein [Shewanella fidelis]MDW4811491.1 hypothetical protein [Shewanella fidelis]MDW4815612.1 hypothetical protein [Shewanella fidelis]MDW4819702.1 hypothetical protein [Shewanella fidelis]MDW4824324.1 hypothetical protein [Shewanella fidelis]
MNLVVTFGRKAVDLKFKALGLKIIQDIPTDDFNRILEHHLSDGWVKTYEYDGFDAWIDYGKVKLIKYGVKLNFEWDNWCEGEIIGKAKDIDSLASKFGLKARETRNWWPKST